MVSPDLYELKIDQIQALEGYNVHMGEWIDQEQFHPRHNIAPRTQAPVIRRRQAGSAPTDGNTSKTVLHTMKWGLVPHWAKHEDNSMNTINARYEALIEGGGMWGSIKGRKRCALPCEGYYEWLKKGKERIPHFTKREDGKLMLLAGMYDIANIEGQTTPLWTFTIVTTGAAEDFRWLHDRQPVILSTTESLQAWLDTSSQSWTPDLSKLVQPYSGDAKLTCYAVPQEVGKVGAESSTFIQPISQRKDGIEAMFAKQSKTQSSQTTRDSKRKRIPSPDPSQQGDANSEGPEPHETSMVLSQAPQSSQQSIPPNAEVIDLCDTEEEDCMVSTQKSNTSTNTSKSEPRRKTNTKRKRVIFDATTQVGDQESADCEGERDAVVLSIHGAPGTHPAAAQAEPASSEKITSFFKKV
ncbi:hypothetical protein EIP86_006281 [Pleurotus ostreatoroseus]|nr:hypothetical protein EIP86_006281 [Pleurotus ostreatoroseus]